MSAQDAARNAQAMAKTSFVDPASVQPHPATRFIPRMREAEWRAFLEDVRLRGITTPVDIADGHIVDGRHRWEAARETGRALPARLVDLNGMSAAVYAIKAALLRRHLTDDQRGVLAARLSREMRSETLDTQRKAGEKGAEHGRKGGRGHRKPLVHNVVHKGFRRPPAIHIAAEAMSVPRRIAKTAAQLDRAAPDLAEKVLAGDLPLKEAVREAKRSGKLAPRKLPPAEKRANLLTPQEWMTASISVWSDLRKTAEEQEWGHPAIFPQALPDRLIGALLSTPGVVLDPFCGIGSTLLAAHARGHRAIGLDISPDYADIARRRAASVGGGDAITVHTADARDLERYVGPSSIDLTVTSPPYWDVLRVRRTADGRSTRPYAHGAIGETASYEQYIQELAYVFAAVHAAHRADTWCAVVVMDLRHRDQLVPLHMDLAQALGPAGWGLEDIIIWDRRCDYNFLRPLGYPTTFRVNKVHEYILLFRHRQ